PHCGVAHDIAKVDEAAGERPESAPAIDRPAREENGAVLLGECGADDLRIQIEDEPAARAHVLLPLVRWHRLAGGRRATERAEADRVRSQDARRGVGAHVSEYSTGARDGRNASARRRAH